MDQQARDQKRGLRCQPGDYCLVVGGAPENLGAHLTVISHESGMWLFDGASRPLVAKDGARVTHSYAAVGEFYGVDDAHLLPIHRKVNELIEETACHG